MRLFGKLALLFVSLPLAVACSADSPMDADASGQALTDGGGITIPDAQGVRPDGQSSNDPDAMVQVTCKGADTEPNNVQLEAENLGEINDCDYDPQDPVEGEGGVFEGSVISGDEDWFAFNATDGVLCSTNPSALITGNVQVCLSFVCTNGDGTLELTCPDGTTEAGGGLQGCCGTSSFEITDYNCLGTLNEASQTHGQVTALSTDTCEAYSVAYHF